MTMTWPMKVGEMVVRWVDALSPSAWLGAEVALAVTLLTLLLVLARLARPLWKLAAMVVALPVAAFSIYLSLKEAWIADDAFISYRYARNFAAGDGMVFNLGERLEGYTNFLWTLILGIGQWVHLKPEYVSTAMTLSSLAAIAVVGSWKLSRPGWIPVGPLLLVLSPALLEFGTSGLEAGPAAMCIGFSALWVADEKRRHAAAWWVLTAALLRPDHALFFAPLGIVQLFAGRRALRHLIGAGLGFALYWLGRWAYFSEFFPNTFHAKSGGGAYWHQGTLYLVEFALSTGAWLAIPVLVVVALVLVVGPRDGVPAPRAALLYAFAGSALFGTYIARIGGDFMEFRFGLTSFVLFAFGADLLLSTLTAGRTWATALAGLAFVPLGIAPRLIKDTEKMWHIAHESSFYRVKRWVPLEIDSGNWGVAMSLATLPDGGAHAPPLAAGCIGMIGYLTHVPIIDRYGLTNAGIAHKKIKDRGRPGHEKWGTTEELMEEGAQWSVDPSWAGALERSAKFRIGTVDFWLLKQTPQLSSALKLPTPQSVLSAIQSREEAFAQHNDVSRIYAELPDVLSAWRNQWGLVDASALRPTGTGLKVTPSAVTATGSLTFSIHRDCPTPLRLRWTQTEGQCEVKELRCADGVLDGQVRCVGPFLTLKDFRVEPSEFEDRLKQAAAGGPVAVAHVLREEDGPAVEGTVARFRFDDPSDLQRPGVEQTGKVFDVANKPVGGQGTIIGMHGAGLLNGFAWGDGPKGRFKVTVPVEPGLQVLVSFLFAGSSSCDRVYAVLKDGDTVVDRVCGRQDEMLRSFAKPVTPKSDKLVIEISDDDAGGWGHALFDDLLVWRRPDSEAKAPTTQ